MRKGEVNRDPEKQRLSCISYTTDESHNGRNNLEGITMERKWANYDSKAAIEKLNREYAALQVIFERNDREMAKMREERANRKQVKKSWLQRVLGN